MGAAHVAPASVLRDTMSFTLLSGRATHHAVNHSPPLTCAATPDPGQMAADDWCTGASGDSARAMPFASITSRHPLPAAASDALSSRIASCHTTGARSHAESAPHANAAKNREGIVRTG
jgi:hypothetical protein